MPRCVSFGKRQLTVLSLFFLVKSCHKVSLFFAIPQLCTFHVFNFYTTLQGISMQIVDAIRKCKTSSIFSPNYSQVRGIVLIQSSKQILLQIPGDSAPSRGIPYLFLMV